MRISIRSITMPAAIATFITLAPLASARTSAHVSLPQEASGTLKEMKGLATNAGYEANQMEIYSRDGAAIADIQITPLQLLKEEINEMQHDVASLEAERGSLALWEVQAVDRISPLLNHAAANTESALKYYNEYPHDLWTPEYRNLATSIRRDADQVARTLKDYLKSEKIRAEEERLENRLNQKGD